MSLAVLACNVEATSHEPTSADEAPLATAKTSSVESVADEDGEIGRFAFELVHEAGKRVAVVRASRGQARAELECSQLTNISARRAQDEIVTLCEEATSPGVEYVSVYFRYRPATQKWSYDVIGSRPQQLTERQHDLYELFTGRKVTAAPPSNAAPNRAHRAELNKLALTVKSQGTDPFADPIALAEGVLPGLRGALGTTGTDRSRPTPVEFKVDGMTSFTSFDTLLFRVNVQGHSVDEGWRSGRTIEVSVAASPTTLASSAQITNDLKTGIGAL